MTRGKHAGDPKPFDPSCECFTCQVHHDFPSSFPLFACFFSVVVFDSVPPWQQTHSRGYIHHLLRAKEPTGMVHASCSCPLCCPSPPRSSSFSHVAPSQTLCSIHNLHFMNAMMAQMREDIMNDKL